MQTKLTVRVNEELLRSAKLYAQQRGISLSRLIENYLRTLAIEQDETFAQTPILRRLTGILSEDVSLEDQHKHWEEKYAPVDQSFIESS